jgi:DNA-directed RNA polymerase I subunit RPA1
LRNFDSLSARYNPSQAAAVLEQEHAVAHMKTALASRAPDEDYVAPTLSLFNPARHFGSVSETFAAQIAQHVEENPGRLLQAKKRVRKAENWPEWIDHKKLQTKDQFRALMHMKYIKSLVDPGEAVGLLASQGYVPSCVRSGCG